MVVFPLSMFFFFPLPIQFSHCCDEIKRPGSQSRWNERTDFSRTNRSSLLYFYFFFASLSLSLFLSLSLSLSLDVPPSMKTRPQEATRLLNKIKDRAYVRAGPGWNVLSIQLKGRLSFRALIGRFSRRDGVSGTKLQFRQSAFMPCWNDRHSSSTQ